MSIAANGAASALRPEQSENFMTAQTFRVGVVFPQTEIGTDPIEIRDFAQAIEDLGFSHLNAYDHIVGADVANRPDWKLPFNRESMFHEPLMLFSYLAGLTQKIDFSTSVLILPQRQTALFGKQAANLDIFCGGRLRLGVGSGNNPVEYEALDERYETRGTRLDDQIRFLRRLWTEDSFTESTEFHKITEAGINPLPLQRPIPIWIGGNSPPAMRRAVRSGDGWMPTLLAAQAAEKIDAFREALAGADRDPAKVPFENHILLGTPLGGPIRRAEDAVADAEVWKKEGASGVFISSIDMGLSGADQHLALFRRIADMLGLERRDV
jgi:probable F420-dependent oxidoreductase